MLSLRTRSINYTAILEKQNRRITAKNEEDFGANPPLHIWSLNNADHIGEAKCRRRNCISHTNPAKLSKVTDRSFRGLPKAQKHCTGDPLPEETANSTLTQVMDW